MIFPVFAVYIVFSFEYSADFSAVREHPGLVGSATGAMMTAIGYGSGGNIPSRQRCFSRFSRFSRFIVLLRPSK